MKKKIFIAAVLLVLFVNAQLCAAKTNATNFVTLKMQDGLRTEFGKLHNVNWKERPDNYIVASFQLNNQSVEAYFNLDGEYSFCTTAIGQENLPLKVSLAINRRLADKKIKAILQMCNDEGTSYYIMASDTINGKTKVYKAYTDGQIQLFQKI